MAAALTIMTWNVENLFRPGGESGPVDQATYDAKLDYLCTVINGVHPDAVALQEVGHPAAAADLRNRLGRGWRVALSSHPDDRGIRVGVLARHQVDVESQLSGFPIGSLRRVPDVDKGTLDALGRGVLQVRVQLAGGYLVRLVTAHLKSKLLTYPNGRRYPLDEDERARGAGLALLRRAAESVAVRIHLNAEMARTAGMPTVLAGDLNDGPDAVTTVLLTGPADGNPNRPDKGDPVRLYNLADRIAPGRAYSRIYRGRPELIDHLLVSRDLLLTVQFVDALVEGVGSITESVRSRREAVVPDHAPVLARFALP